MKKIKIMNKNKGYCGLKTNSDKSPHRTTLIQTVNIK